MTVDIGKIRDERLTEDEKMELIADYLENGGGGGSNKLRVKVNVDYTPTNAAEVNINADTPGFGTYSAMSGVSFQDEDGNAVDIDTIKESIINGNLEIYEMDHLGDIAVISGESVTVQPGTFNITSFPVSTLYSNDSCGAFGEIYTDNGPLHAAVVIMDPDTVIAVVGVFVSP